MIRRFYNIICVFMTLNKWTLKQLSLNRFKCTRFLGALKINMLRTRDLIKRLDIIVSSLNSVVARSRTLSTQANRKCLNFHLLTAQFNSESPKDRSICVFKPLKYKKKNNEWKTLSIEKIHYIFRKILRFPLLNNNAFYTYFLFFNIHTFSFNCETLFARKTRHTKYSTYYIYFLLRFNFPCNKSKSNVLSSTSPSENLPFLPTPRK